VHACAHAPVRKARPSNPHVHTLHTLWRSSIHTAYMYTHKTCAYARLHHFHFYITAYIQHAYTNNIHVHIHVSAGLCDMHSRINTCVFRLQHCNRIQDRRKSWALPKGSSRNFSPPPPPPVRTHTRTHTRTPTHKHTLAHSPTHLPTRPRKELGTAGNFLWKLLYIPPHVCAHTPAHTHAHTHTHTPTHPLTHSRTYLRTNLHDRGKSWHCWKVPVEIALHLPPPANTHIHTHSLSLSLLLMQPTEELGTAERFF